MFSLAGCRRGYVVGCPSGIRMVQKLCTPHNTNAIAIKFAEAMLNSPELVDSLINKYNDGRQFLIKWLDRHGYKHKGDAGNYIFIKPKTDAKVIVNRMKEEKRILIKVYPAIGILGDCLRVTIGERKYMEQFIIALQEIDK